MTVPKEYPRQWIEDLKTFFLITSYIFQPPETHFRFFKIIYTIYIYSLHHWMLQCIIVEDDNKSMLLSHIQLNYKHTVNRKHIKQPKFIPESNRLLCLHYYFLSPSLSVTPFSIFQNYDCYKWKDHRGLVILAVHC